MTGDAPGSSVHVVSIASTPSGMDHTRPPIVIAIGSDQASAVLFEPETLSEPAGRPFSLSLQAIIVKLPAQKGSNHRQNREPRSTPSSPSEPSHPPVAGNIFPMSSSRCPPSPWAKFPSWRRPKPTRRALIAPVGRLIMFLLRQRWTNWAMGAFAGPRFLGKAKVRLFHRRRGPERKWQEHNPRRNKKSPSCRFTFSSLASFEKRLRQGRA